MPNHGRAARTPFDLGRSGVGEGAGSRGPGEPKGSASLTKPGPRGPETRETNVSFQTQDAAAPTLALGPVAPGLLALDRPRRMTDGELLAEVRRVAALVDGPVFRVRLLERHSTLQHRHLCRRFGSWRATLLRAGLAHLAAPERSAAWRAGLARRYDDEAMLETLRAAARAKGSDVLRSSDIKRYTGRRTSYYDERFGSWAEAVERAGLKPVWLRALYSEAACFDNLRRVWMHLRRPPRGGEMARPPSTIREDIYRRRWGSWRAALEAFVARVNATPDDPLRGAVRAWSASLRGRDSAQGAARAPLPPALLHGAKAALRLKILERDGFRCVLCGASPAHDPAHLPRTRLEIDHITPFARGGRTEAANLRTLCHACNAGRGAANDEHRGAGE